uniref:Uncharacterized protein n=1 Tax=Brassica campestris TaxID=3711 RepID=A0A3P5YBK7_BRACM|nr:unnamed protein product [Brassica rapa]
MTIILMWWVRVIQILWLLVLIYTTLPPIYEEGSRFLIAFLTRGVRLQACQWSWSHFLPRSLIERYMY